MKFGGGISEFQDSREFKERPKDEDDGMFICSRAREALVAAALCESECDQLNTPFLNQPDAVTHRYIVLDTFSNQQLTEKIGFNRNDARRGHAALRIPDYFTF